MAYYIDYVMSGERKTHKTNSFEESSSFFSSIVQNPNFWKNGGKLSVYSDLSLESKRTDNKNKFMVLKNFSDLVEEEDLSDIIDYDYTKD